MPIRRHLIDVESSELDRPSGAKAPFRPLDVAAKAATHKD
jgi:hypothetical protein